MLGFGVRRKRSDTTTVPEYGGPVGTEAKAARQTEQNAKDFAYPSNGFFTRIEHSLLYAMINEPTIFPADVVIKAVQDEDLDPYLYARPDRSSTTTEARVSYAQLSALMERAGEHWSPDSQVPQAMGKAAIKCVIRHAEKEGLDRKAETDELIRPLRSLSEKKGAQMSLAILVPAYTGMALSMATGNPLPLLLSSVAMNVASARAVAKEAHHDQNLSSFVSSSSRMADVEKTSLLDEYTEEAYDDHDDDH